MTQLSPSRSSRLLTDGCQSSFAVVGSLCQLRTTTTFLSLQLHGGSTAIISPFPCYSGVSQSGLQRGVGDMGEQKMKRRKETQKARKVVFMFSCHQSRYPIGTRIVRSVFSRSSHQFGFPLCPINQSTNHFTNKINNRPSQKTVHKPPNASQTSHQTA